MARLDSRTALQERRIAGPFIVLALASILVACSGGAEQGVVAGPKGSAAITLSEGPCATTCPVYDMTLHADGAYQLNGVAFVKETGLSEGNLGVEAFALASKALEDSDFWRAPPVQTAKTTANCHPDAPTAQVTWRTEEGKEKTLIFNAGCEVDKSRQMIIGLRKALHFDDLVWTDKKFDFKLPPPR